MQAQCKEKTLVETFCILNDYFWTEDLSLHTWEFEQDRHFKNAFGKHVGLKHINNQLF